MTFHSPLSVLAGIFVVFAIGLFALSESGQDSALAQEVSPLVEPDGGGEFLLAPMDEITDEQREAIQKQIRENVAKLQRSGRLAPARPEAVVLEWPTRKAAGLPDYGVDAVSNYVDQNAAFPNQLRDWNCGTRTYDRSNGYNHKGIDIFTWPFSWRKMDNNEAEVVAGAPGTIVLKSDGNFDRSCSFNSNSWNAIYVQHSDGSRAWYGHLKSGSLNAKAVGDTVVTGEKLGVIGSSGNSTGPHLHFELYNAAGQLQDPYQGPCNTLNTTTWWAAQEPYRASRINSLILHSAPPSFNTCPAQETTNEKSLYRPGESVLAAAYYRDQTTAQSSQFSLIRPDGTVFQAWSHNSPNTYSSSYWFWSRTLPADAPLGEWKLRSVYNSETYERTFTVDVSASVAGRILTPDERGLRNALVTITDSQGVSRTVNTSSFGYFGFDRVALGQQYTIRVASKRYRFSARTVQVNDNLTGVDFAGQE